MPVMKFCPNNHYYDAERHASCPYCKNSDVQSPTSAVPQNQSPEPKRVDTTKKTRGGSAGKTIGFDSDNDTSFVVGWLVCTEGADKGKDFRLHAENNYVGREFDNDVILSDEHISRKHFAITYDPIGDTYFASMSGGKAIVYVNGKPLTANAVTLQKGDKIKIAKTTLVFIPLESALVNWEWD